jgi:D-alanine-D-alanine ligase
MRIGLAYNLKDDFELKDHQPIDDLEEYDCQETITALESALGRENHQVLRLGGGRVFLENILKQKVDLVFNIAEGWGGRSREAQVPGVLEMLGIPYTGSDPNTLAFSQDKGRLNVLLSRENIKTPGFCIINRIGDVKAVDIPFPLIVKPLYEGSSKGIRRHSVVYNTADLRAGVEWLLDTYHQPVLAEQYIRGEEVTVGIVGNSPPRIVGVMQICPKNGSSQDFVYSLEVKRDWQNQVDYICPARLSANELRAIKQIALDAYRVLECRDFARVDIRLAKSEGIPYFIEINPLPGLNPAYSDMCIMANKMGIAYDELIASVLNSARERYTWKE